MKTTSYSSSYSSFGQFQNGAAQGNHNSLYYPNNNNNYDEYNKIQKKSSLKEILKNKKPKDEIPKSPIPVPQTYVQKYYKKTGMSATIYKENKLGKHIWPYFLTVCFNDDFMCLFLLSDYYN